jgi:phosphoserine phosphatase
VRVILARHGETEWNVEEIFRGQADVALNEKGLKQAELLATYLQGVKIEAVYSSPLKRAFQTARAVAKYQGIEPQANPGLNDLDFGEWEGLPLKEVAEKYKDAYQQWLSYPESVKIPGGETLAEVRARALALVSEVVARHRGTVVLASHRVIHKIIICALLGLDNSHFWNFRMDTCGITTFTCENGRYILDEHNNTCFLKPLEGVKLSDF